MARYRIWLTALFLLSLLMFSPKDVQSRQYFDATLRFDPMAGTLWHYQTLISLSGMEIEAGSRTRIGGVIWTIYDEEVTSSGSGLVNIHTRFNTYESLDLSFDYEYEDPTGGPWAPPDYGAEPVELGPDGTPNNQMIPPALPRQSAGGGDDPGGGSGDLVGEGDFKVTPIMESNINYVMSESGRMLNISGLELVGEIIDPSRSITVRQLFQTVHFVVLPDYEVHLNETWRAPMSWTIPYVGETMEIPLTFTLADIRTTYRFRMAAIDFFGILHFDVDIMDEGMLEDENGILQSVRKESNIEGDIVIQGRAYIDLDRGILVALADGSAARGGSTGFVDGDYGYRGQWMTWGVPTPGFYAMLNFERSDLYTPLGNVIDQRQELVQRIQELRWYTTTVVE